ncbi:MAG: 6-bladed beta-propeller [Nitrospirota bacterium]
MCRRLFKALWCVVLILATGCSTKWVMDADVSETQQLWVQEPRIPKARHVLTIRGFKETGTSLKSVLFGKRGHPLLRPVAVATGRDGRIAIVDAEARCVALFRASDQSYSPICGTADIDFVSPVSAIFDEELRLYVADSALGRVFVFDAQGAPLTALSTPSGGFARPTGLAYNLDRKMLYVIDTVANKIYAYSPKGELLFSFGERGTAAGQFNYPTHLFWSPAGLLYVTDAMNFRIQIFNDDGTFRTAFGSHGDGSGDFAMPKGVAVDRFGTIYVVDSLFDNVQLFTERGNFLLTLGRRGSGHGEFWLPSGAFIDSDRLYISDTYNQRVQVFQLYGNPYEQE